ncbi:helix-turn-helix domain-containing protein [Lacticaseibacillus saniviri]
MNKIADTRKKKGLTLKELGAMVNLGSNTISRYETGKREPKLETWQKLADALDVSVPYLTGLTDSVPDGLTFDEIQAVIDDEIAMIGLIDKLNDHSNPVTNAEINGRRKTAYDLKNTFEFQRIKKAADGRTSDGSNK